MLRQKFCGAAMFLKNNQADKQLSKNIYKISANRNWALMRNEEFRRRLSASLVILQKNNISESSYSPPMYKLYWKIGFRLPPPHFLGFFSNMLISGLPLGISAVGLYMMGHENSSVFILQMMLEMLVVALFFTVAWGSVVAMFYERDRKRHQLPRWSSI
ncbi:DUF6404 family protein [Paucibacter sp. KCTC 42545]|uniref:DUF6404 family protein n=1 Tax=Paucibacter sp. KCTC 42545 TaxID=1768242 RepID=UPI0012E364C0|nr:DUF6404 family protein [Paucibacter sp. KCTC 42545]